MWMKDKKTPFMCDDERGLNVYVDVDEGQKTPFMCANDYIRQSNSPKLPMAVDMSVISPVSFHSWTSI